MNASIHPEKLISETYVQTKATKQPSNGNHAEHLQKMTVPKGECDLFSQQTYGVQHQIMTLAIMQHLYTDFELIKRQDDVAILCSKLISLVINTGLKLKALPRDNTQELRGIRTALRKGIILTTSSFHSLQSNGLAERMNLTLMNKIRTVLRDAGRSWK